MNGSISTVTVVQVGHHGSIGNCRSERRDRPYYAITGSDGVFEIGEIPPGRYDLTVWHPELGLRTTTVMGD